MSLITSDYNAALEYAYRNAIITVMIIYLREVCDPKFPEIEYQYMVTPEADNKVPPEWDFVVAIAA